VSVSVAAIVLAAGASRRLGQPKQLLMLGGEALLERAIRLAGEAGAAPVLTVLGANR
jgi:molybdenum cofactor cytidylyltransferase